MSLRSDAPAGRRPRPEELASPRAGAVGTGEVFGVIAMAREANAIFQAQERERAAMETSGKIKNPIKGAKNLLGVGKGKSAATKAKEEDKKAAKQKEALRKQAEQESKAELKKELAEIKEKCDEKVEEAQKAADEQFKARFAELQNEQSTETIYYHEPVLEPDGKLPNQQQSKDNFEAGKTWQLVNDLNGTFKDGVYFYEAAIMLDAAHRSDCGWVEPFVRNEETGGVNMSDHWAPTFGKIGDCGTDGLFMYGLTSAKPDDPWALSDYAQQMRMQQKFRDATNRDNGNYLDAIESDIDILVNYDDKNAARHRPYDEDARDWSLPDASKGVSETMVFRSVAKALFAHSPERVGKLMLAKGYTHNAPPGTIDWRMYVTALNDMVVKDIPWPTGDRKARLRQLKLETFVGDMCLGKPVRGAPRKESAAWDPSGAERMEWLGGQPAYRIDDTTKDRVEVPVDPKDPAWEAEKTIQIKFADGRMAYGSELMAWSHWVYLDDSVDNKKDMTPGDNPRGSVFVRYVDWKDAYNKFPGVPLFKPDSCEDPLKWEAYVDLLRKSKLQQNKEINGPKWEFDADVFLFERYMEAAPKSGTLRSGDYHSEWECCMPPGWEPSEWFLDSRNQDDKRGTEVWRGDQLFASLPESLQQIELRSKNPQTGEAISGNYLQLMHPGVFDSGVAFTLGKKKGGSTFPCLGETKVFSDLITDDYLNSEDRLKIVRAFTALGEADRTAWREDKLPGPTDYLYVIVVCAGSGKDGPAGAPGFGLTMLRAVHNLAAKLGVRRVVLSALPVVVSYYHYNLGYDVVTRSGRSLQYFEDRPKGDPYRVPKGGDATNPAYTQHKPKGSFLDLYSARLVTEEDFRDPMLREAAEAPESNWTVTRTASYEFYTHRTTGAMVHNPPVPYFHKYQNAMREQRGELFLDNDLRMQNDQSQIYKDHFSQKARDAAIWYEQQQRNILASLAKCGYGPNWWVRNNRAQKLAALAAAAGPSSVIARPPPQLTPARSAGRERDRSPKPRSPPSGTPGTRRSSRKASRITTPDGL